MKAKVGDHVITEGARVDSPRREGRIVSVSGEDGEPPYRVRWSDGHESLWFPGSDSHLEAERESPSSH